ncbi:type II toxin-antitoxin system HigB family toxin [bacterium]|nr:type II toxin-antitoxin system HigB family toxin [bacterium]
MRILTRKRLNEYCRKYPATRSSLEGWHAIVKAASWKSLADVRKIYPSADAVVVKSGRTVTVFNIAGNKSRLLVALHYNRGRAYVLDMLSHAEYDRGNWKEVL